jgi:large subunit ribosomal protein L3
MALSVVGRKCGMSRIFTEDGTSIPVTVIEVLPNHVTQVKTESNDGYRAVQITTGTRHRKRLNKAMAGIYAKAGVDAGRGLWEIKLADGEGDELSPGVEIRVDQFQEGQRVDVSGITIGRGFAGTIRRHNFRSGDATHGNSLSHRVPGSIGQNQTPGRVFKGKKMSGHLGNAKRSIQNLEVVRVDLERNLLLIKGAVPGARGGDVVIQPAVKSRG